MTAEILLGCGCLGALFALAMLLETGPQSVAQAGLDLTIYSLLGSSL